MATAAMDTEESPALAGAELMTSTVGAAVGTTVGAAVGGLVMTTTVGYGFTIVTVGAVMPLKEVTVETPVVISCDNEPAVHSGRGLTCAYGRSVGHC